MEALLYLVDETARAMRDLAEEAASRTQARLEEALAKLPAGADRRSVTVATIREASPYTANGLVAFAATLQALTWAVTPPAPDARPLAY